MIDRATIHLPAVIAEASFNDPVLNLVGDAWYLTVTTAWRVSGPDGLEFGAYTPDASDRVWDLIGLAVVEIAPQSPSSLVDPAFILSTGLILEVFSLDSVEPWIFRIADQIWVASPTDLSAFD